MVIVNAKQEITSGVFTRSAGGCSTILDYVLTSGGLMNNIKSLTIDEHTEIFTGSDHAGLILEVEQEQSQGDEDTEEGESIYIPMNAEYETFHILLDEAIQEETEYEGMSINNKTIFLQEVLRKAGRKAWHQQRQLKRQQGSHGQ